MNASAAATRRPPVRVAACYGSTRSATAIWTVWIALMILAMTLLLIVV